MGLNCPKSPNKMTLTPPKGICWASGFQPLAYTICVDISKKNSIDIIDILSIIKYQTSLYIFMRSSYLDLLYLLLGKKVKVWIVWPLISMVTIPIIIVSNRFCLASHRSMKAMIALIMWLFPIPPMPETYISSCSGLGYIKCSTTMVIASFCSSLSPKLKLCITLSRK